MRHVRMEGEWMRCNEWGEETYSNKRWMDGMRHTRNDGMSKQVERKVDGLDVMRHIWMDEGGSSGTFEWKEDG